MCVSAFFFPDCFWSLTGCDTDSIHHFVPTQFISIWISSLSCGPFGDKSKLVAILKHPCAGVTVFSCDLWSPEMFHKLQKGEVASEMAGNGVFLEHKMKKSFQLQVAQPRGIALRPHQGPLLSPTSFQAFSMFLTPMCDEWSCLSCSHR